MKLYFGLFSLGKIDPGGKFLIKIEIRCDINSSELTATIPSKIRFRGGWYYFSGRKEPFLMKLYFGLFSPWQIMIALPIVIVIADCSWLCWQCFCFVFIRFPSKSVCEAHWCDKTWYFLLGNEYNCVVSLNRIRTFEFSGHVLRISGSKKRQQADFHR